MTATPPKPLQQRTVEARLIRQKIWKRMNVDNQHFIGVFVGREGSGKSLTALKLAEAADPTFSADRVMFDPEAFLRRLQAWKESGETTGKMVVADEAGVGLGVRTWYDEDQILFNQVLQVIRDENMGILFTLPTLSELDSQTRKRLHAFIEMTDMDPGEWAEFKWLNWSPTRDERDDVYRHYPELRVNGWKRKIKRLRVGPPSPDLIESYEARKDEFQAELYQEAIDSMSDEEVADVGPHDVVDEIETAEDLAPLMSWHSSHKKWYVDKDLIRARYDLSHSDAATAKKLLVADADTDVSGAADLRDEKERQTA